MAEAGATSTDSSPSVPPRQFIVLLVLAAVVGLVVSLAAWCFLEAVHWTQEGVFDDLPDALGFDDGAPVWWPLPVCALGALVVAFAIVRLPGGGGHVPAHGLNPSPTAPVELPGVMLAAVAGLGLGLVLGPEAPLLALGGGLATLAIGIVRRDAPPQVVTVIAASGSFAALSFIFDSPLIAAVILIEATGIGGERLPLVVVPGLLAAGIGSLVSLGMGSWTGVSTSDYALGPLAVPAFARPDIADFAWTIPFAVAVAVVVFAIVRIARTLVPLVTSREFLLLPVAGLVVGGLAIVFSEATDKSVDNVLYSGQDALPTLVSGAGTWSLSALALLLVFKGLAYAVSLASFRGGPVFPAIFLGAAGGLMASHLAGFAETPAVAVGMGAALVAVLGLPLSAVVLAVLLTSQSGHGASPIIIVGVVVAYLTTRVLSGLKSSTAVAASGASAG
jgi:H+/Cl- antiporter ClcA